MDNSSNKILSHSCGNNTGNNTEFKETRLVLPPVWNKNEDPKSINRREILPPLFWLRKGNTPGPLIKDFCEDIGISPYLPAKLGNLDFAMVRTSKSQNFN